jgi:hypothetical protein
MAEVREALFFLTGLLSPFSEECPDAEAVEQQDWRRLTWLSGCYLITPSLAHQLARCGLMELIPEDVAAQLREVADNVTLRNQQFQSQLAELVAAFDAASLPYAVLKGGAYLVAPVYPTAFMRVMGDLDLLVARERLEETCGILSVLGYDQVEDESLERRKPTLHRHLSPFLHDGHIAAVELHREALPTHLAACAPAAELLRTRQCHRADGQDCYTLSPTFRLLNLVMHSEIIDCGYANGAIPLRGLEEYAYTVKAEGGAIDWLLLRNCFSQVGRLHVLMSFLWLANRLLGVPMPETLSDCGLVRARLHYRRCLLQFESRLADRWLRRWSRYSGTSSLDRLGVEAGVEGGARTRLHVMKRVLRRRLGRG